MLKSPLMADTNEAAQIELEDEAVREGIRAYHDLKKQAIKRGEGALLKPVERLMLHWMDPMVDTVTRELRSIRRGQAGPDRAIYGPLLACLDAERIAFITMSTALGAILQEPRGVRFTKLAYSIGNAIVAEIHWDLMRERDKQNHAELREMKEEGKSKEEIEELRMELLGLSTKRLMRRVKSLSATKINWWAKKTLDEHQWDQSSCVKTGAFLLWTFILNSVLEAEGCEPVTGLVHKPRSLGRKRNKTVGYIELHPAAVKIIGDGHERRQFMRPRYLPMIVSPYPWTEGAEGGYVKIRTPFVSNPRPIQKRALAEADLSEVHSCLNAVNEPAWSINTDVLAVIQEMWEQGGNELEIPRRHNIELPPEVESTDDEIILQNKRDRAKVWEQNTRVLPAARETFLRRLYVARKFAQRERFYFPHQMDFRGRCYPIPQPFNHQCGDVCRGLLRWAHPCEPDMDEVRVEAANAFGFNKIPFDQRIAWAKNEEDRMRDCARRPHGNEWWKAADDPFQFLACCFAMDDERAAARLPVRRDGTCNGLQWYAALGRDPRGGAAVNLIPAGEPERVYQDVADVVSPIVAHDARQGDEIARLLDGLVTDKVTKPNVMTQVYGVTQTGAREQVEAVLRELGVPDDKLWDASKYLSGLIMNQGIGEVCEAANRIMGWLRQCARLICRETGAPIRWTTPIGLPVVQPYFHEKPYRIRTACQWVDLHVEDEDKPCAIERQVNGFPPNYVHSLDATHMLVTARACRDEGIDFAAVHDSYWTHAGTAADMGHILRREFVGLQQQPLLGELATQLYLTYDIELPPSPRQGTLDITQVMDSPYFFA